MATDISNQCLQKAMEQGMLDTVKMQILTLFPAILSQCISWLGPIAGPIAAGVAEGSIQVLISQASSMINRKEGGEHPATGITGLIRNPNSVTINRVEDGKEEYQVQTE